MLAKLKKQNPAKDGGTPWRVDFRDVALLPDTKKVRTEFLVNILVFTVVGVLALVASYREIALSSLKTEIASIQEKITAASVPNKAVEASFKLFQAEEKKLKEVQAWSVSDFSFPDFLIHLAELMPVGVRASRIEYKGVGNTILVIGSVDGQDAAASVTASKFFEVLVDDPKFKESFSSIKNSNLGRNASADALSFELIFTFIKPKPAAKK